MSEPLIHALHEPDAFSPISGDLTPVLLSQEMPGGMQPIQRQADARLVAIADQLRGRRLPMLDRVEISIIEEDL